MIAVIQSEWIKLRSVRSNLIVFSVAVVLVVGAAIIAARVTHDELGHDISIAMIGVQLATLLFAILGVQIIGQEYRFNTIQPTLTAVPNRRRVLLAKLVTITVTTFVFSVVMLALSVLVVKAIGPDVPLDDHAWRALAGTVAYSVGFAAFGFAIGAIVRQPIAGIIVVVMWPFALEPIIAQLSATVGRFMPFTQGGQMASVVPSDVVPEFSQRLDPNVATIYFFAFIAVLVIIGLVLADRRDA